eukprot:2764506-Prymnesium_polylepis.1
MDAALQGLAWESCMPYLDDVGICSTGEGATDAERETASFANGGEIWPKTCAVPHCVLHRTLISRLQRPPQALKCS